MTTVRGGNTVSEYDRDITILWLSKNTYSQQATLDSHAHEYYQIHFIWNGKGYFCIDGQETILTQGMLLLVKPGIKHGIRKAESVDGQSLSMLEIRFAVNHSSLESALDKLPLYFHIQEDLQQEIKNIYDEGKAHAAYCREIIVCSLLNVLYKILRTVGVTESPISTQGDIVMRIKDYINRNYANDISLDDLSQSIGYSKNYLCKVYRNQENSTINALLNNVRIDKAIELLLNTDMELSEIAGAVGYHNIYHFTKTFKKIVNISPGNYRRKELSGMDFVKDTVYYEHVLTGTGIVGNSDIPPDDYHEAQG